MPVGSSSAAAITMRRPMNWARQKPILSMSQPSSSLMGMLPTRDMETNAAAAELLPEGSLDYAALNIPEDLFATKQFAVDLDDYESVYQEIWSEFKLS